MVVKVTLATVCCPFELASGLVQWARRSVLASPSPTKLSITSNSLVGVRARYVQPYEDNVLGGGVLVLDASILEVSRAGERFRVRIRRSHSELEQTYEVDDVIFDPNGKRTEKVVFAPESTLERVQMSPSDMQDIQHGYHFVLTTADVPEYDIKYVGKQKVDEVNCYVFDVSPKQIEKGKRYLLGRIWVDATDLQIVVTNGRMVPDDTRPGHEDLHPPFMTWRQQIDGHYWFPVYTKGEGILHFAGGNGFMAQDVHIRDVVKYTDYKRFGSTSKIIFDGQELPQDQQKQPQNPQQPKQK